MASVLRGSGDSSFGGNLSIEGVLTYEDVTSVDSVGVITARSGIDVGTGTSISSPSSNVLTLGTNSSERIRITSDGKVKIGNNPTEGHSSADDLTIDTSSDTGMTIRSGTSSQGSIYFSDATSGAGEYAGWLRYSHLNNDMTVGTASGTRVTVTGVGSFGIGNDDPTYKISVKDTKADGTGVQLHLWNNSTDNTSGQVWSGIRFTGSTGDYETAEIKGWRVHPGTGLNSLSINTGGVERMVLCSDGVGIGTNDATGTALTIKENNNRAALVQLYGARTSSGNNAFFSGYTSRGSVGTPATLIAGDTIATFNASGHDGSNYLSAGRLRFNVESVSTGSLASDITFLTNDGTTETERLRITSNGSTIYYGATGNAGGVTATTKAALSGGGTLDLEIPGTTFVGHLYVTSVYTAGALSRTVRTYFVTSRLNNGATITQLNSANGTSGGVGFTITEASGGSFPNKLRFTDTSSLPVTVAMHFVGATGL